MENDIKNVLEWLDETAERCPEKTAFDDGENRICFSEVRRRVLQVGAGLLHLLVCAKKPEQDLTMPVAVLSGRNIHTPIAFLGVVAAGCFYAPLDAEAPIPRLQKILQNLKPEVLIVSKEFQELAEKILSDDGKSVLPDGGKMAVLEDLLQTEVTDADLAKMKEIRQQQKPDAPLYVIHTSGSSGTPKGVLTGHASLINYINAYTKVMGIGADDVLGNQSPLDYIAAIRDIYVPLKTGATTIILPKKDFVFPGLLFDDLTAKKVTSIGWSVNAMTIPTNMGAFEKGRPEYLNKICFSGSVMPCRVLKIWQEHLPEAKFVNQYGPTEATASCTYYEVKERVREEDVLPIGVPYDNYEVFLLNEDGTETKDGEIGEICVGGPVLALGYLNAPELTAKSFVPDPREGAAAESEGPQAKGDGVTTGKRVIYKTGDLGRMAADGNLEFHGRKDRQIKHLGHRVELDEIEDAAKRVDGITDCTALYKEDAELIYLFYTGTAGVKEIATALRASLPGFMVPRKFVQLEEMPHLANGKTDMQALKQML